MAWEIDPCDLPNRVCRGEVCFKSPGHAQRFLSAYGAIAAHFRPRRHRLSTHVYRQEMTQRFLMWQEVTRVIAPQPTRPVEGCIFRPRIGVNMRQFDSALKRLRPASHALLLACHLRTLGYWRILSRVNSPCIPLKIGFSRGIVLRCAVKTGEVCHTDLT
jgi:hypothetical protein